MKYRKQLMYFIDRDLDFPGMFNWIDKLPDLEQPQICRELIAILEELHQKTGEDRWLNYAHTINEGLDDFEDEILEEQLRKQLFIAELSKVEFNEEKVAAFLAFARGKLIESILNCTDKEEKEELWDLVLKTIAAEKKSNLYKDENWSVIFDTLE